MKIDIINANCDLGISIDGANLGPRKITNKLTSNKINAIKNIDPNTRIKSYDKNDLRKNESQINIFNSKLYNEVTETIQNGNFPITIGGDHVVAIGSSLASQNYYKNLGLIWIDAHADYNTFNTTITGNLHGLPFAAVSGFECKDLTKHLTSNLYNQSKCVLVGARSIDDLEQINLNNSKVTVFTTEDIKKYGIKYVMNEAIKIASNDTNGIHISYDLDIIDAIFAPGVSVPEENGIDDTAALEIVDILSNNLDKIKSMDLVEYNPIFDKDDKTLNLSINILNKIIEKAYN